MLTKVFDIFFFRELTSRSCNKTFRITDAVRICEPQFYSSFGYAATTIAYQCHAHKRSIRFRSARTFLG